MESKTTTTTKTKLRDREQIDGCQKQEEEGAGRDNTQVKGVKRYKLAGIKYAM